MQIRAKSDRLYTAVREAAREVYNFNDAFENGTEPLVLQEMLDSFSMRQSPMNRFLLN